MVAGVQKSMNSQKGKQTGFLAHTSSAIHKDTMTGYIVALSPAIGDTVDKTSTKYAAGRKQNQNFSC